MKIKMMMTKINNGYHSIKIDQPMKIMLLALGGLFALIFAYKIVMHFVTASQLEEQGNAPIAVSTMIVGHEDWAPRVNAVGNVRAVHGVDVVSEVDGMVEKIYITANQEVKAGEALVQLKAGPDIAALNALQAEAKLAELTYKRNKDQFAFSAVSAETLEEAEYTMKMAQASAQEQAALVEQKTIRAPFDGKLGINFLNLGQFIAAGDPLISLQSLNPLYVYFFLPEQYIPQLTHGQTVQVTSDSFPERIFSGKITGINPNVDYDTRNIEIETTIENPKLELLPGMYARIMVETGKTQQYITIPQSAISYNPYGNLVYVVMDEEEKEKEKEKNHHQENKHKKNYKKGELYVKQKFVSLGDRRGDQVVVLKGLEEGEEIVTSGQLKLKNGSHIVVNNDVIPSNDSNPDVKDEE